MGASRLLLVEALQLGLDVAPHLARGQTLGTLTHEAERPVLARHELGEVALLGLETARGGQVPAVLLPGRGGDPDRLLVGPGDHHVDDEPDHRLVTLDGPDTRALVLLPGGS